MFYIVSFTSCTQWPEPSEPLQSGATQTVSKIQQCNFMCMHECMCTHGHTCALVAIHVFFYLGYGWVGYLTFLLFLFSKS